ncbi:hypothetical protein D3C85_1502410 [compost metagenome]
MHHEIAPSPRAAAGVLDIPPTGIDRAGHSCVREELEAEVIFHVITQLSEPVREAVVVKQLDGWVGLESRQLGKQCGMGTATDCGGQRFGQMRGAHFLELSAQGFLEGGEGQFGEGNSSHR